MQALPAAAAAAAPRTRQMPLAVAIVGRPNVGKSSLVNAITGMGRAIVSDLSGTTHDAVDTELALPDGTPVTLVDTAGIRKRGRVAESSDGAEKLSVARAIRAMRRTDVVAILLDSVQGITSQDIRRGPAALRVLAPVQVPLRGFVFASCRQALLFVVDIARHFYAGPHTCRRMAALPPRTTAVALCYTQLIHQDSKWLI